MKRTEKKTPGETLRALEHQAEADRLMDEVLAMSPEDVERELLAAGYDMAEVRKRGLAMQKELEAAFAPPRPRVTRLVFLLAAALGALLLILVVFPRLGTGYAAPDLAHREKAPHMLVPPGLGDDCSQGNCEKMPTLPAPGPRDGGR